MIYGTYTTRKAPYTYDAIGVKYAEVLSGRDDVVSIRYNVHLEALGQEKEYMSDFICQKANGELMVRECVFRKHLKRPLTAKLLEDSRSYWQRHGVMDWWIVGS